MCMSKVNCNCLNRLIIKFFSEFLSTQLRSNFLIYLRNESHSEAYWKFNLYNFAIVTGKLNYKLNLNYLNIYFKIIIKI